MLLAYIALGGAIGASLRYLSLTYITRLMGFAFPYGTMTVNIAGSVLMGILAGYLAKTLPHSNELRAFLAVGVLGGFTTFSSFSLDAMTLIDDGMWHKAVIYVVVSVLLGISGLFLGMLVMR